jgi:hypothetical protein
VPSRRSCGPGGRGTDTGTSRRSARWQSPITWPLATSNAAKRDIVPWRTYEIANNGDRHAKHRITRAYQCCCWWRDCIRRKKDVDHGSCRSGRLRVARRQTEKPLASQPTGSRSGLLKIDPVAHLAKPVAPRPRSSTVESTPDNAGNPVPRLRVRPGEVEARALAFVDHDRRRIYGSYEMA